MLCVANLDSWIRWSHCNGGQAGHLTAYSQGSRRFDALAASGNCHRAVLQSVASPVWLMLAMLELDELHVVSAVTSPVEEVVPPEVVGAPKVPVAVNCCVPPG